MEAKITGFNELLKESREEMSKEASKASKIEKKLNITLGGYQARSKALSKRVTDAFNELVRTKVDYESFARLSMNETITGPQRLEALKEEVDVLSRRERLLQERYAELDRERGDAESRVAALEEKIMEEAEALNEAALAEEASA
jgi:pre-mRNA-splicing factor CDC5/CEF1